MHEPYILTLLNYINLLAFAVVDVASREVMSEVAVDVCVDVGIDFVVFVAVVDVAAVTVEDNCIVVAIGDVEVSVKAVVPVFVLVTHDFPSKSR